MDSQPQEILISNDSPLIVYVPMIVQSVNLEPVGCQVEDVKVQELGGYLHNKSEKLEIFNLNHQFFEGN